MSEIDPTTRAWIDSIATRLKCDAARIFPWPQLSAIAGLPPGFRPSSVYRTTLTAYRWSNWTWHELDHYVTYTADCTVQLEWITRETPDPSPHEPGEDGKPYEMIEAVPARRLGKRWLRAMVISGPPGFTVDCDKDV